MKLKQNVLKKFLEDNFQQSSLIVTTFAEIRKTFNIDNNDIDFIGVIKASKMELFGSSGFWAKRKNK